MMAALPRLLPFRRALFPDHYDFSPATFLLPEQADSFFAELAGNKGRDRATYILKLDNGSMVGVRVVTAVGPAGND